MTGSEKGEKDGDQDRKIDFPCGNRPIASSGLGGAREIIFHHIYHLRGTFTYAAHAD